MFIPTYSVIEDSTCEEHGSPIPRQAFWRGSQVWECSVCHGKWAGVECLCELDHVCRRAGAI